MMIFVDAVLKKLEREGMVCTVQKPLPHGIQLRFSSGVIVNVFKSGKVTVQGKETKEVERLLGVAS